MNVITTEINDSAPEFKGLFLDSNGVVLNDSARIREVRNYLNAGLAPFNDGLAPDLTGYFIRQLTAFETQTYEVLYKPLKGTALFPVSSAYDVAATSILFEVNDYVGESRVVADYDVSDFPEADVLMKQLSVPVRGEGASFSYTIQDIRASAMRGGNTPLSQSKQTAARRAIEQGINKRLWFGDSLTGRVGVLTDPDVPYGTVPNDGGTGSSTKFVDKTGQQIYRDISDMIIEAGSVSGGIFNVNMVVLPIQQFNYIQKKPFAAAYQGKSVMAVLKENFPGVTFDFANELTGASSITPSNDVMIAYEKNPMYATFALPIPFEMFPPQLTGLKYSVYVHARTAGMMIKQPKSMTIKEGI